MSPKPAWSTPGQSGLRRETLSQKTKKKKGERERMRMNELERENENE